VLHGGGGVDPGFRPQLLAEAGGPRARVVLVPYASAVPENWQASLETWRRIGAEQVELLDVSSPGRAVEQVEQANLVWLGAGDQVRLVSALAGMPVVEALRRRYRAGLTVAGISAGVAALSAVMITGEPADESTGATHVAPGLGLWPEVILDQHVLARQRVARLERAVLDHPGLVGVGVDEDTSVVVEHGRLLVVAGDSAAVVVRVVAGRVVTERVAAGASHLLDVGLA
jgi:cyanophycinase